MGMTSTMKAFASGAPTLEDGKELATEDVDGLLELIATLLDQQQRGQARRHGHRKPWWLDQCFDEWCLGANAQLQLHNPDRRQRCGHIRQRQHHHRRQPDHAGCL